MTLRTAASLATRAALCVLSMSALSCTTGEGHGQVVSDQLFVESCWNGRFALNPTFFGANPFREQTLLIRVQRGDNIEELSDGLIVLVNDLQAIRETQLGQPIAVGLPVGVTPPGVPETFNPNPPLASLSLYLHDTCHASNATLYSVAGSITFNSLFSGDPNELRAEDRLTDATFSAQFADPRHLVSEDAAASADLVSTVSGRFEFFFQRGQPAQPFP